MCYTRDMNTSTILATDILVGDWINNSDSVFIVRSIVKTSNKVIFLNRKGEDIIVPKIASLEVFDLR